MKSLTRGKKNKNGLRCRMKQFYIYMKKAKLVNKKSGIYIEIYNSTFLLFREG